MSDARRFDDLVDAFMPGRAFGRERQDGHAWLDTGYIAGEMAYEILENGKKPGDMEVKSAPKFTKKYNAAMCEALNITAPEGYEVIAD